MEAIELEIHRANTLAFIAAKPTSVTLIPIASKTRKPSGGYTVTDGTARDPQQMRIIELGARGEPATVKLQDGTEREVNFWLLGAHDAAVAIGDHWTEGVRVWEIGDIIRDNQYEVRALVAERGA
jgi:hypothetical protein